MKLEQQVVSLELAKEMKELGFKQESLFYLVKGKSEYKLIYQPDINSIPSNGYSAYTVAELGEMLPVTIEMTDGITPFSKNKTYVLSCHKFKSGLYSVCYVRQDQQNFIEKTAETEADARAKMLCYLKKNNLI